MYLGVVKLDGYWRFFYDDRETWILDYRKYLSSDISYPEIDPKVEEELFNERRVLFPYVNKSNAHAYCKALSMELSAAEIAQATDKPFAAYMVNFDENIFIELPRSDGYNTNVPYVPDGWVSAEDNPYYYIPTSIRDLWLNKHQRIVEQKQATGIYDYTYVGAVHFQSQWTFYYEMREAWYLDFSSFITKVHPDYFVNSRYSDWRHGKLAYVDENHASDYLATLSQHEIRLNEVPNLVFNQLDLRRQGSHPTLRFIVDFDNRIYVDRAFGKVRMDIDPSTKYAPSHWSCHIDNPLNYIPKSLRQLWIKQ